MVVGNNDENTPMVMVLDCPTKPSETGGEISRDATPSQISGVSKALLNASKVVSLIDPSSGQERQYLCVPRSKESDDKSCDLLEIQRIKPSAYRSYFVGSRVVSDGALYVSTRVDPLYFVLNALTTAKTGESFASTNKWQPLEQVLAHVPDVVVDAVNESQLRHLCEATNEFGDDLILYKFSPDCALAWLKKKQDRAFQTIHDQMVASKREKQKLDAKKTQESGGAGAYSSTFRLAQESDDEHEEKNSGISSGDASPVSTATTITTNDTKTRLSKQEEKEAMESSVQVVCAYLSPEWSDKLVKACSLDQDVLLPLSEQKQNDKTAKAKKSSSSSCAWDGPPGAKEANQLLHFTMGGAPTDKDDSEKPKTTKNSKQLSKTAKTAGLKRLAKVNTKGMKSLSCFFGASAPKKQKKESSK